MTGGEREGTVCHTVLLAVVLFLAQVWDAATLEHKVDLEGISDDLEWLTWHVKVSECHQSQNRVRS